MKKMSFVSAAMVLALSLPALAGEFRDRSEKIAVDFPAGWTQGKSDDPFVTLKLEKGRSTFEFAKQESELSDYYLKARVKENVDSLRGKGAVIYGDIKTLTLHGVASAHYAAYEMFGNQACMAFLTYNGVSYSVAAINIAEGDFRGVLSTVRKPGENVELSKRPKVVRVKKEAAEAEEPGGDPGAKNVSGPETEAAVSSAAVAASSLTSAEAEPGVAVVDAPPSAAQLVADSAGRAAHDLFEELAKKTRDKSAAPYYERKPLPVIFWGGLLAFWFLGSFLARSMASSYRNPKLSPPPAEVPPDFFFPFIVSRAATIKDVTYSVVTRQKQLLMASFQYGHEIYFVVAVYGCLFFHAAWSVLDFTGRGAAVIDAFLWLPGGRFFASVPEGVFIVPLFMGIISYATTKRVMSLYDAQSNLVMEAAREITYCLIRDGSGKEVARLVPKKGAPARRWDFVDTDNLVIFAIQDDCPRIRLMRKLFGNLGGALRARYGIFVQDRRAGFVFLDPSSPDRFQVHMDYDFARLAHPAQILIALLYVISREKDPVYPSPF